MDSIEKENIRNNLAADERDETEHSEIEETKEETNSAFHIQESKIKHSLSAFDQSENDRSKTKNVTDSKSLEIHSTNKDETKIKENLSENFSECKQVSLNTHISPPVKRKSQQISQGAIKRKRTADNVPIEAKNDEILTDSLNVEDADLYIVPSENPEKHLTSIAVDNTTDEDIKERDIAVNQTDHNYSLKCKITATIDETDLAHMSKAEVSNISKGSEDIQLEEALPQQEQIMRRTCSRGLMPLEDLENDLVFVENQKQILESISHQRNQFLNTNTKSDNDKEKSPKSSKNKDPKEIGPEISLNEYRRLKRILKKYLAKIGVDVKDFDMVQLQSLLMVLNIIIDTNDTNDPDLLVEDPENETLSSEEEFLSERSVQEIGSRISSKPENNDRFPNSVESEDRYPDSSSSSNQPDKISETDYPEFREYPGLAADPTKVKKDARYQKKFYRRKKPVLLPINRIEDAASTSEIEPNIGFEENKVEIIDDDPRILSGNSANNIYKDSEDPKISKDEDSLKEKEKSSEIKLSEISESTSENKSPSMKAETTARVKDESFEVRLHKQHEFHNISSKKIPITDVESPKKSPITDVGSPNSSKSPSPKKKKKKKDEIVSVYARRNSST